MHSYGARYYIDHAQSISNDQTKDLSPFPDHKSGRVETRKNTNAFNWTNFIINSDPALFIDDYTHTINSNYFYYFTL